MKPYPLKFNNILKPKIWGGRELGRVLGKRLPPDERIGESWEIADHGEDSSTVRNGAYKGVRLHELVATHGQDLLGTRVPATETGSFPLLIKFLDAQDWLSVQVHPHDEYARVHQEGERGKTEVWYVVSARPGAKLVCGFSQQAAPEVLRLAIQEQRLGEYLREVPVQPGDVVFVPAGRVHTLGPGIVTCEIQRNSDVTYRLFDWGRVDDVGRPRDLHVDDALNVMDFSPTACPKVPPVTFDRSGYRQAYLVACRHFACELLEVRESCAGCCDGRSFQVLCVLQGGGLLETEEGETDLRRGDSLLLPAGLGNYRVVARGPLRLVKSYVPDLARDIVDVLRKEGRNDTDIAALGGEGTGNDVFPLLAC
jgi:mannose-6-phosphate isomerase